MKGTWFHLAAFGAVAAWAAIAFAYSSNPPVSRTNAPAIGSIPAETNCTGCHGGNALNTGGSVTLLGVPNTFVGGTLYHFTVHLASSQTSANSSRDWGFEITAVDSVTGVGVGTFTSPTALTSVAAGSGSYATRTYARQTGTGGDQSGTVSPVEWQVDWTAPATGTTSAVKFYFVGLAGNGSGTSGDWVYTGSAGTRDIVTPASTPSWGQVKARYNK